MTREIVEEMVMEWLPIESAPETKGGYLFCLIAWGPEDDMSTAYGFRHQGKWFAGATFYKGGPPDGCQYEIRQIEVSPRLWMRPPTLPAPPSAA